jgi:hypothetical protein
MLAATVARGAPEVIAALGLLTLGLPVYGMFRRISGRPTAAERKGS